MSDSATHRYAQTLEAIRADGLFKSERIITSPQDSEIELEGGRKVLNFCANNYLGLADDPSVIAAAKEALDTHGFGMASVRFICGTQDLHKQLEAKIAAFFGTEDAILYAACFDANGGLFEPLLGEEDAVISDARPGLQNLSKSTLPEANRLIRDLRELSQTLRGVSERVEQKGVGGTLGPEQLPDYKPRKQK